MFTLLLAQFKSPLILILLFAPGLSVFLHDPVNALIILTIVLVSGLLGFWQAHSATNAVEQLLAQTLLQLARTMGKKDSRSIRVELKISHEELSEMVGTTRPRIGMLMQRFLNLGLIERNLEHFLIIKEKHLTDYLAQIA